MTDGEDVGAGLLCGDAAYAAAARRVEVAIATAVVVEIPEDEVGLVRLNTLAAVGALYPNEAPLYGTDERSAA